MGKLSAILHEGSDNHLMFQCPGCRIPHVIPVRSGNGPRWDWNGDVDKPTFNPSILVRYRHWTPDASLPGISEKIISGEIVQTPVDCVCHSFVRDGRIQFLGDCTHELKNQTVDIPPFDDD